MKSYLLLASLIFTMACSKTSMLEVPKDQSLFQEQELNTKNTLSQIAIGSCNEQGLKQEMWQYILANNPDLWIWLGDNIYGDSEDMEVMKNKYLQQKYGLEYQNFRKQVPVVGIWDDHDYGVNNGGKEYSKKDESQALMLDFLDVPKNAPVRNQAGGYQSYTFGPEGKKVKVLLLDSRYHRDQPISNPNRPPAYLPNEVGTILGEAQWAWLEQELENSKAQVHLIANGIQVIPQDHSYEKWFNFPKERERLFQLLKKHQVPKPVLLSGDRHIAEISKLEFEGFPIVEITSSGMTHSYEKVGDEPNRHRVSKLIGEKNFGMILIDWSKEEPHIKLEVRGLKNNLYTSFEL